MKTLNIFISSPGDVLQERLIAKQVINELATLYSDYIEINSIMWEDLPLDAAASFQSGINYFLENVRIDVSIFILWSRLGTILDKTFLRKDGTPYKSGTEYEFDMMYSLWEQTGLPKIMVYVKDSEIQIPRGSDRAAIKDMFAQQELLQSFIEEKFRDRETGTNYAYWQFDRQQSFEERLRTHLTRIILDRIGENVHVREWEGNPYVGLRSFEREDSAVFCGRKAVVYDIVENWLKSDSQALFLLGESGSGKSSLVKAGIIPHLVNLSGDEEYQIEVHTPASFNGAVYDGILDIFRKSASNRKRPLLLFLDQFEEIFTDKSISEEERNKTLDFLQTVIASKMAWLILSMRSDFYGKIAAYPALTLIKMNAYAVDIPTVSAADIADIIKVPAKKANLTWETNERGESLVRNVIADATDLKDLPLIEFGLAELYKFCSSDEKLTFEAYEKIGKLKGAVAMYADSIYNNFTAEERASFNILLGAIITTSTTKQNTYVRRTAHLDIWTDSPKTLALIKKLTDAHLLVSGKDAFGQATITIAHEMLLDNWSAVQEWLQNRKEFINRLEHYERLAITWENNGRKQKDLISERSSLLEAEYFVYRYESEIVGVVKDYLRTSLYKNRHKGMAGAVFGLILSSLALYGSLILAKNGNCLGIDLEELIGIKSSYLWGIVAPFVVLFAGEVWRRIRKKYEFQTIAGTARLWLGTTVCLTILCVLMSCPWSYFVFYVIPLSFITALKLNEYYRRKAWVRSSFRPYLLGDSYEKIKGIVAWSIVGVILISISVVYVYINNEKEEKAQEAIIAMKDMIIAEDYFCRDDDWTRIQELNEYRRRYFAEHFGEKYLQDWDPDRIEGIYGLFFYNLLYPEKVLQYLYTDDYDDNLFLAILATCEAGQWPKCAILLENYVDVAEVKEERTKDSVGTKDIASLIFIAEKLGRFDLAEKLYSIINKKNVSWLSEENPGAVINYGHIFLSKGETDLAMEQYRQVLTFGYENPFANSIIKLSVSNDLNLFKWLDVIPDSLLRYVASQLELPDIMDFHTGVSDSLATKEMCKNLEGTWALRDSSIVIEIPSVLEAIPSMYPICRYKFFEETSDGGVREEYLRKLTNFRFSYAGDRIYWEEFDQGADSNSISISEIIQWNTDSLMVRIIDNGNDDDRGTYRLYYAVHEE